MFIKKGLKKGSVFIENNWWISTPLSSGIYCSISLPHPPIFPFSRADISCLSCVHIGIDWIKLIKCYGNEISSSQENTSGMQHNENYILFTPVSNPSSLPVDGNAWSIALPFVEILLGKGEEDYETIWQHKGDSLDHYSMIAGDETMNLPTVSCPVHQVVFSILPHSERRVSIISAIGVPRLPIPPPQRYLQ